MAAGYQKLLADGELKRMAASALKTLESCSLCPRMCRVNRLRNETGYCGSGRDAMIASYNVHYGEEPPISGTRGSGTIFFSNCTLRCIYCQNYPISQLGVGEVVSAQELSRMMLTLQKWGVHNINLVTPTHIVPQIIEAVYLAASEGLSIPIAYNSSGYETVETLRMLDGIVDIYLPDIKYATDKFALSFSGVSDYVYHNRNAIREMFKQAGGLVCSDEGIAKAGLIVRHLVLPGDVAGTEDAFRFIKSFGSEENCGIFVSLMTQYFPAYRALGHAVIGRKIVKLEADNAVELLLRYGLDNGWVQDEKNAEWNFKICG